MANQKPQIGGYAPDVGEAPGPDAEPIDVLIYHFKKLALRDGVFQTDREEFDKMRQKVAEYSIENLVEDNSGVTLEDKSNPRIKELFEAVLRKINEELDEHLNTVQYDREQNVKQWIEGLRETWKKIIDHQLEATKARVTELEERLNRDEHDHWGEIQELRDQLTAKEQELDETKQGHKTEQKKAVEDAITKVREEEAVKAIKQLEEYEERWRQQREEVENENQRLKEFEQNYDAAEARAEKARTDLKVTIKELEKVSAEHETQRLKIEEQEATIKGQKKSIDESDALREAQKSKVIALEKELEDLKAETHHRQPSRPSSLSETPVTNLADELGGAFGDGNGSDTGRSEHSTSASSVSERSSSPDAVHQPTLEELAQQLEQPENATDEQPYPGPLYNELYNKAKEDADRVPGLETELERLRGFEEQVKRLPQLEEQVQRLPELEQQVKRLPQLEEQVQRLPELEEWVKRLPELENRVQKLPELEEQVKRLPELEEQLQKLKDENSHLSAEEPARNELEAKIVDLKAKINDLEANMETLSEKETKLENELELEKAAVKRAKEEVEELRQENESQKAAIADIQTLLEETEEAKNDLESQERDHTYTVDGLLEDVRRVQDELDVANLIRDPWPECDKIRAEAFKATAMAQDEMEAVRDLLPEIRELEEEWNYDNPDPNKPNNCGSQVCAEITNRALKTASYAMVKLNVMQSQMEAFFDGEEAARDGDEADERKIKEIEDLQESIRDMQQEQERLKAESVAFKHVSSKLRHQLRVQQESEVSAAENEARVAEIQELKDEIETLKQEEDRLRQELESSRQQAVDPTRIQDLEEEKSRLTQQLTEATERVANLEQELAGTRETQEVELQNAQARVQNVEQQQDMLQQQLDGARDRLMVLEADAETSRQRRPSEDATHSTELQGCQDRVQVLEREGAALQAELADTRGRLATAREQIANLERDAEGAGGAAAEALQRQNEELVEFGRTLLRYYRNMQAVVDKYATEKQVLVNTVVRQNPAFLEDMDLYLEADVRRLEWRLEQAENNPGQDEEAQQTLIDSLSRELEKYKAIVVEIQLHSRLADEVLVVSNLFNLDPVAELVEQLLQEHPEYAPVAGIGRTREAAQQTDGDPEGSVVAVDLLHTWPFWFLMVAVAVFVLGFIAQQREKNKWAVANSYTRAYWVNDERSGVTLSWEQLALIVVLNLKAFYASA